MKRGKKSNRLLDYYVGVPALQLAALLGGGRREPPPAVERIGVMFNHALGDTLLGAGPTQDIRAHFRTQEIVLFAASSNLGAAKLLPGIDRIVNISLVHPWSAITSIRAARLDYLLDFTSWQRLTAFLTLYSGAKYTIGFRTHGQHRHRAYDHTVLHRNYVHELENQRALVRAAGVPAGAFPKLLVGTAHAREFFDGRKELIVLHAWPSGTRSWLREWPAENWLQLTNKLRRPGRCFVLTGAPSERSRTEELCRAMLEQGAEAVPFIGENGIEAVARLLQRARLLISVNTGIMHLSSILGTPTISINGPTAERRWGPIGPHSLSVNTPDGTGGFLDLGFEFRGKPLDTMRKIGVNLVFDAAERLLRERSFAGNHSSVAYKHEYASIPQSTTPNPVHPRSGS